MAKVTLNNIGSGTPFQTGLATINANNDALETAIENTLSRDGTSPNTMSAPLDMNSNQIYNLPSPATINSPARLQDVTSPATIASVPPVGTSGAVVGLLNTGNTHSGNNTFSGTNNFTAATQVTTIELGNASDTTLSRTGAGAIAVEGVGVALNSTSLPHTASQFEVGNASDTTISRASAGVIAIEGVNLTPNIPVSSKSADYPAVLADANTCLYHPSSDANNRQFTIPANSSVAYPVGTTLTFVNDINTLTIAITTDTLVFAGPNTTGSRTLAAGGMATAVKVASTRWYISGAGLS